MWGKRFVTAGAVVAAAVVIGGGAVGATDPAPGEAPEGTGPTAVFKETGQALGSASTDLVFVPVAPCRVADTRLALGAFNGGTTRAYTLGGSVNHTATGGNAAGCGIPKFVGSSTEPGAYVLNLTIISTSPGGFLTAFPAGGTPPTASVINWATNGTVVANTVTLASAAFGDADVSIAASDPTHLIIDVMGYYIAPEPTPLERIVTGKTVVMIEPGSTANAVAPTCNAGFTAVATNGESSTFDMPLVFLGEGVTSAKNTTAQQQSIRSSRVCARLPGRARG